MTVLYQEKDTMLIAIITIYMYGIYIYIRVCVAMERIHEYGLT